MISLIKLAKQLW